jgi:hypothetical protein
MLKPKNKDKKKGSMMDTTFPSLKKLSKDVGSETSFIFETFGEEIKKDPIASEFNSLVNCLLHLQALSHIEHVNTRSYARHMALDCLYNGLPGAMDPTMELVVLEYGSITYECPVIMSFEDCLCNVCESISRMEALTPCLSMKTTLGDLSLFIKGVKYKLERLH